MRGEADSGSVLLGSWLAANLANLAVLANDFFSPAGGELHSASH